MSSFRFEINTIKKKLQNATAKEVVAKIKAKLNLS